MLLLDAEDEVDKGGDVGYIHLAITVHIAWQSGFKIFNIG